MVLTILKVNYKEYWVQPISIGCANARRSDLPTVAQSTLLGSETTRQDSWFENKGDKWQGCLMRFNRCMSHCGRECNKTDIVVCCTLLADNAHADTACTPSASWPYYAVHWYELILHATSESRLFSKYGYKILHLPSLYMHFKSSTSLVVRPLYTPDRVTVVADKCQLPL